MYSHSDGGSLGASGSVTTAMGVGLGTGWEGNLIKALLPYALLSIGYITR